LQAHPDVDLIASSSRESNPKELVEKWGFVPGTSGWRWVCLKIWGQPLNLLLNQQFAY
jgi:hypothetical protein